MKLSCAVIKDLLPLYKDELCSSESKKLVEEHIAGCESCQKVFEFMNKELKLSKEVVKDNMDNANMLIGLSKKWNKKLMFEVLKGIGIGILTMILVILFLSLFIGFKIG